MNMITGMMWGGTVKGDERAGLGTEFRQVVGEMTALLYNLGFWGSWDRLDFKFQDLKLRFI
ncbi:hypothetical protein ACS0TY_026892 [Phlomoides rotata]